MDGMQVCAATFGGAQSCFDGNKASLLHQTSPTIDGAIISMTQEEVLLSLEQAEMKVVSASTFVVTKHMEWRYINILFYLWGERSHEVELSKSWQRQGI